MEIALRNPDLASKLKFLQISKKGKSFSVDYQGSLVGGYGTGASAPTRRTEVSDNYCYLQFKLC